ncbi:5'-AMP-activated protein kinase subunit beta-2 [Panulirus ornatus]|uniref:5'-AMP-activated protein kinase subunit beta-2 n=1 Tax=Panulirus ornatus TaxID=150431 RepID=UPI003A86CB0D
MGNHASSGERRDRNKPGEPFPPYSPGRIDGQAFTFDKHKAQKGLQQQPSEEEHEPVVLKASKEGKENEDPVPRRPQPILTQGNNKKMLPFVIKWSGGGNSVAIAGTFNEWQTIPMVKSEKDFVAIVDLPEGHHEYKFLVDGEWKVNQNEAACNNNMGTQNNTISISESDFEEFENALLRDPNDKKDKLFSGQNANREKVGDKKDEYSQEIPEYQQSEKIRGPPVLPPHLLQVILNKDTPISCEPTLLPEPNHVMLNHMYALSIRDGMMVLSTSHRFRKKCVTTLIYRPIE